MPISAAATSFASSNSGWLKSPGTGGVEWHATPLPGAGGGRPSVGQTTLAPTRTTLTISTPAIVSSRSQRTSLAGTSADRVLDLEHPVEQRERRAAPGPAALGPISVKRRLSRCADVCPRTSARTPALSARGTRTQVQHHVTVALAEQVLHAPFELLGGPAGDQGLLR